MDRFINGEEVPIGSLRKIWQNTTQPSRHLMFPVYEQFFRAVRAVNVALPAARRVRVLLGDPPVDWDRVTRDDLSQWNSAMRQRDSFPAELIRREVISKNRRALVVYGDMHLQRRNLDLNYDIGSDRPEGRTIVQALELGRPPQAYSLFSRTRRLIL
jgi:hypothetical protein